jgi:hypothetical protein
MCSRSDLTLADVLTDEQYRALQKRATEFQSANVAGKSDIVQDTVDQIERTWQGDAVFDRETIEGVSALCSQIAGPFSPVLSLFASSCTLKLNGLKREDPHSGCVPNGRTEMSSRSCIGKNSTTWPPRCRAQSRELYHTWVVTSRLSRMLKRNSATTCVSSTKHKPDCGQKRSRLLRSSLGVYMPVILVDAEALIFLNKHARKAQPEYVSRIFRVSLLTIRDANRHLCWLPRSRRRPCSFVVSTSLPIHLCI